MFASPQNASSYILYEGLPDLNRVKGHYVASSPLPYRERDTLLLTLLLLLRILRRRRAAHQEYVSSFNPCTMTVRWNLRFHLRESRWATRIRIRSLRRTEGADSTLPSVPPVLASQRQVFNLLFCQH